MIWIIVTILVVLFLVGFYTWCLVFLQGKRLTKLEKEVFKLLKGLDDKNYKLWKEKEKLQRKLHKKLTKKRKVVK